MSEKKSFLQLMKKPQFALSVAILLVLAVLDILAGSRVVGISFIGILLAFIALNMWKTR